MAKNNGLKDYFEGIPSQDFVPAQIRYKTETAANEECYSTARPVNDGAYVDTNGAFSTPVPDNRYEPGRFQVDSHTNGKAARKLRTSAPGDGN